MTSQLFHRSLRAPPPRVSHGEGGYLFDQHGKKYLDACGGAAVSCIGHSRAAVNDAIKTQLDKVAYAHSGFFTNDAAEDLARRLIAHAPPGFGSGRAMFLGSGSEAMEAALKLARQYHLERGEDARAGFISRALSYHGNTLGALAVSGHPARRAPYAPLLAPGHQIPPCHAYRWRHDGEDDADYGARAAEYLDAKITELGAHCVAAFVAEPVVGATLGSAPAAGTYFRRVREICDRHGVLFIADEIMCGMGRTGSFFAIEQEGVAPDLITVAKGLGAGYQPVAAVLASAKVCAAVQNGSGDLWNGHTYMSHAASCAGALAVLDVVREENLLENVRRRGARLGELLRERFAEHPRVGDIRGRGLFYSLELVADKDAKTPFPVERKLAAAIKKQAFANGLLCYPSSGCADGVRGDHVLLAPAYDICEAQLAWIVDCMEETLAVCLKDEGADADKRGTGERRGRIPSVVAGDLS